MYILCIYIYIYIYIYLYTYYDNVIYYVHITLPSCNPLAQHIRDNFHEFYLVRKDQEQRTDFRSEKTRGWRAPRQD